MIVAYAGALEVIAALASALMRATIAAKPLERCGVKCSRRPSASKMGMASVARISSARLPCVDREQDRDEPAHDVGVAVGMEGQARGGACGIDVGGEPDLARAAAHLIGIGAQGLGKRR